MSIKTKDNELIYLGCIICREIEALEYLFSSDNEKMFNDRFNNLVALKNRWSKLMISEPERES